MKRKKRKPVIGEKLYRVDTGNRARNGRRTRAHVFVRKVGKKYFRVNESMEGKDWTDVVFHIASWTQSTDYSTDYLLFESEQEYIEKKDADDLFAEIKRLHFSAWVNEIPLEKLRQIKSIIEG